MGRLLYGEFSLRYGGLYVQVNLMIHSITNIPKSFTIGSLFYICLQLNNLNTVKQNIHFI